MLKISLSNLKKETPDIARRIGNALVAASVFGCGYGFITDNKTLAIAIAGVGMFGKFLTECFAKDDNHDHEHEQN